MAEWLLSPQGMIQPEVVLRRSRKVHWQESIGVVLGRCGAYDLASQQRMLQFAAAQEDLHSSSQGGPPPHAQFS